MSCMVPSGATTWGLQCFIFTQVHDRRVCHSCASNRYAAWQPLGRFGAFISMRIGCSDAELHLLRTRMSSQLPQLCFTQQFSSLGAFPSRDCGRWLRIAWTTAYLVATGHRRGMSSSLSPTQAIWSLTFSCAQIESAALSPGQG